MAETRRDKLERNELYADAVATAVNAEMLNRGAQALDEGFSASVQAEMYIKHQNEIKTQLVILLRKAKSAGLTDSEKNEVLRLKALLQNAQAPQVRQLTQVETQDIPTSYESMIEIDMKKAVEYGIDLNEPFLESFSNIDRALISRELAEEFDLLRLDKFDYAFATFAGIMGGAIDALFVGTITEDKDKRGKLLELTDNAYEEVVKKYAKMRGWKGPKVASDGTISDPTKSAIGFLERNSHVNYDQRYRKDIKKLVENLPNNEMNKLGTKNHHLESLSHSFSPLGLITGVLDLMNGTSTFYDPGTGSIHKYVTGKEAGIDGVFDAVTRWFDHCMSDIAGASGSSTRGAGLPAPFMEIFQQFQFGKIPLQTKKVELLDNNLNPHKASITINGTIGEAVEELYKNGLDFRAFTAMAIPVIITEFMVRIYWFIKQHFYFGKSIKESMPFGKSRELQRLLLISSLSFSSVDVTHAIIKGAEKESPITMLLTINYVGLVNFGYKLYMNFRLEHEHNKQLREHMQNDVRTKFETLLLDT